MCIRDRNVVGELGEGVKITLSDFEPYRKLTADEAYLYTMGAKMTLDSDGLILPFYGRAYFFRENDQMCIRDRAWLPLSTGNRLSSARITANMILMT